MAEANENVKVADANDKPTRKYRIIKKQTDGIEIKRFIVEYIAEKKQAAINPDELINLVKAKKVESVDAYWDADNSQYILNFNGTLSSIEEYRSGNFELQCRIIGKDGKCIGYKARNESGKVFKITTAKAWDLANKGCIVGIAGKIISNKKCLIGDDEHKLSLLPKLENQDN